MQTKRIAAGIVSAAVLVGSVGLAVLNNGEIKAKVEQPSQSSEEYTYEYGALQSLYFKINELWRLSINSDMDTETVNALTVLNNGFDSEVLMKAVKAEGDGVIDEYIYSVLAGLDFELYLSDKEAYEKTKADANYTGEVLTLARIDEYLNQLNEKKAEKQVNEALSSEPKVNVPAPNTEITMPEIPTAQSVMPEDPAEAIRRETEAITNRAMGIGVE